MLRLFFIASAIVAALGIAGSAHAGTEAKFRYSTALNRAELDLPLDGCGFLKVAFPMDKQVLVAFNKMEASLAAADPGQHITCKRVVAKEIPGATVCGLFVLGGCSKPF